MDPEDIEVEPPRQESDEYVEEMAQQSAEKMIPVSHFAPPKHDQLADCPDGEVRGIVFHPDTILKMTSDVVPADFDPDDMNQIIVDMATTMYSVGGVGLSAIQIGIPLRVFICDIFANQPPQPRQMGGPPQPTSQLLVAINPEIGWSSKETARLEEGCLSFPSVREHLSRPVTVGLRGMSRQGEPFALRSGGVLGRIIQHEMDHLDGVTFIERMGAMQKKLVSKAMLKFHRHVRRDTARIVQRATADASKEVAEKATAKATPLLTPLIGAVLAQDGVDKANG
jgi:peptide deformylase